MKGEDLMGACAVFVVLLVLSAVIVTCVSFRNYGKHKDEPTQQAIIIGDTVAIDVSESLSITGRVNRTDGWRVCLITSSNACPIESEWIDVRLLRLANPRHREAFQAKAEAE